MGKFCEKCEKIMKEPKLSHCSDECILANIKNSESLIEPSKSAESWNENSESWK